MVQNQFNTTVKRIRTNNGSEFFNDQCKFIFLNKCTIHKSSCSYSTDQTGVVEIKHKHLIEVARVLKIEANVPPMFWEDCILTACYLINLMPSTVLNGLSRYEKLYKKKPKINHLHFFSSLGYAKVLLSVDKFVERSVACVMMRYSLTQKGY